MDWMYNKNPDKVDPDEYLLGRAIDKNYFKKPSPENCKYRIYITLFII